MKFFLSMLSEDGDSNSVSTMRVCSLFIVLGVVGSWAYVSVTTKTLQPLTPEQVGLVLGALGIKAYQRGKENQPGASPK